MLTNNNQSMFDESQAEKLASQTKILFFDLIHNILQFQICPTWFYYILLLIEGLQLLYYSFNPNLTYIFNTLYFTYLMDAISYVQMIPYISNSTSSIFFVLLYAIFILLTVTTILCVVNIFLHKKKKTQFYILTSKLLSLWALVFQTVFILPMTHILFLVLQCTEQSPFTSGLQCYTDIYYVHFGFGMIALVQFFLTLICLQLFYSELNPNSYLPFACLQGKIELYKQFLKIALPIYLSVDYDLRYEKEFMAILFVIYVVLLVIKFKSQPFHNPTVQKISLAVIMTLFWATFVSLTHAFLDYDKKQNLGFFYFILGAPLLIIIYFGAFKMKISNLMQKTMRQMKNISEVELFICELLVLIQDRDNISNLVQLEGILILHARQCTKAQIGCVCKNLMAENYSSEATHHRSNLWQKFMTTTLSDSLEKFQKSARLHLLGAFVYQERLRNKFKALYELMLAQDTKPNLFEEFQIYRFTQIIEEEMIDQDRKTNEIKGFDVNLIVKFQNLYVGFQTQVEQSADAYHEFWRELLEESPDITKLQQLGSKITIFNEITAQLFKRLQQINQNELKSILLYGTFLRDIVNEEQEVNRYSNSQSTRLLEKAEYIQKSSELNKLVYDADKSKYGENSNTCIITCSGFITNANKEITRILGYSQQDIIGSNVSRLMPKVFSDLHDGFMKSFLDTSESKIVGQERLVMAQNKAGYMVPCSLMIKVLPNLTKGIQFVGFLKDVEEQTVTVQQTPQTFVQNGKMTMASDQVKLLFQFEQQATETIVRNFFILYQPATYLVLGISQNCFEYFGIPSILVFGHQLNTQSLSLDQLIPSVMDSANYERMKNQGVVCQIDTSNLRQDFLLGLNESDDEDVDHNLEHNYYDENNEIDKSADLSQIHLLESTQNRLKMTASKIRVKQKLDRYKKSMVKVSIVDEFEFADTHINLIQFNEASDDETKRYFTNTLPQPTNMLPNMQSRDDIKKDDAQNAQYAQNNYGTQQNSIEPKQDQQDYELQQQQQQQQQDIDDHLIQGSERDSSGGFVITEDQRLLREFKQLMTEKRETRTMRMLSRTIYSLGGILIILLSVQFAYKNTQIDDIYLGVSAIYQSYMRQNLLGSVLYCSRMLDLIASKTYLPKQGQTVAQLENDVKSQLSNYVNVLQATQFALIKARITMNGLEGQLPPLKNYSIQFMLQDGSIETLQSLYDDAFIQFLTSASAIRNASLASFSKSDTVESTYQNFYYVMQNGFRVLRSGGENIAQDYYNFYHNLIQSFSVVFIVVLTLAIFFLVLSLFILIPLVFQVHNTNSSVMSLFGLISLQEVKALAELCEKFKLEFFKADVRDQSGQPVEEHKTKQQEAKDDQNDLNKSAQEIFEINNEDLKETPTPLPEKSIKQKQMDKQLKENKLIEEDELKKHDEDIDYQRSQKLLNTKTNNRIRMMAKFILIAAIFIAYFSGDYALEVQLQNDVSNIFRHLQIIAMRPYDIKFCVFSAIEDIVLKDPLLDNGVDILSLYQQRMYNNEREVFSSLQSSFPASFDDYLSEFNKFNYGDLCDIQFSYDTYTSNSKLCKQSANGLLTKGLRTSLVSMVLSTSQLVSMNTTKTKQELVNSALFKQLVDLIDISVPALNYLNLQFTDYISVYLSNQTEIEQIKFSCFMVFLLLVFVFLWIPFNNSLSQQIWRIKGMLNMIPMDVIKKQENLKRAFLSGDIIQAVK